jgi:DNA/RNA endonuclease G (NUC1)
MALTYCYYRSMRMRIRSAALVALALVVGSCSDASRGLRPVGPLSSASADVTVVTAEQARVWISEFHYDDAGTDTDENVEISGPAGTSLDGWQLVLYNGSPTVRAPYTTTELDGLTIPATCGTRGVVVIKYGVNGIQNGDPDGMALIDRDGNVVDLFAYEGSFVALAGPAVGRTFADIGVREIGEPEGKSLWRDAADKWHAPTDRTFDACNDLSTPPGVVASATVAPSSAKIAPGATQTFAATARGGDGQPISGVTFTWTSSAPEIAQVNAQTGVAEGLREGDAAIIAKAPNGVEGRASLHVDAAPLPPVRITEIHYDNFDEDAGESIEIEGPAGADLTGWQIVLYNGNSSNRAQYGITRTLAGTIPATCGSRGVIYVSYLPNGIQNGSPDGIALVDAAGQVVEFLSYEGTFIAADGPARGMESTDIGVSESSGTSIGQSLQRKPAGDWQAGSLWTLGACNGAGTSPPVIAIGGRDAADVPIPVGFEDQLFATLYVEDDGTPSTFTWSSDTPEIASVDADGVVRALAGGVALIRATAPSGATGVVPLLTHVATASTTARYEGNAEFGEPADGDASDDFIVRRGQFTASYNKNRGTPNWVSYNLEATHFGSEDRCDCFTFDPALPSDFTRYTTADYTGAGAFHGYGIDRGHLARSADRTSGSLDNAVTFYFTNIIPQAADNNQGPWSAMEIHIGNLARDPAKEVYVVTGVAGSKGTVKNEGKITIPASVWKVAVIMPRNRRLADIDDHTDLEIIAAIMPNDPGIRQVNWETYKTTVDAVETLSGYDILALLPNLIEAAVESDLGKALILTGQLVASGAMDARDGKWVNNKLELAVEHLAKGLRIPAVNQLQEIQRRLGALVAAGKLSAANAALLSEILDRTIQL